MISFQRGNILEAKADALVNTVNCVGVMGRGIALQFRKAFPENFRAYETACARNEVRPGEMLVFPTGELTSPRFIINFPTKRHWRGKSSLRDIAAGLDALVREIEAHDIKSIAIPPLGCGLGGLEWSEVRPMIESALARLPDVKAVVFEPSGAPDPAVMARTKEVPTMTPGRAALIGLVERYLTGLMAPFVSLLEVHKLMYLMQEAGEDLRLQFKAAKYGPYAENLRHVLHTIEGHYLTGYADGGDGPTKPLELMPGAVEEAAAYLADHPETGTRLDRVSELFHSFETPLGMELLATVHWVMKHRAAATLAELVAEVYRWNDRKKQFTPAQIEVAAAALTRHRWVPPLRGFAES